jgi:Raf kinase inhibitor-like YbhB/YbcL family protein
MIKKYLIALFFFSAPIHPYLQLTSSVFKNYGQIPTKYSCEGDDMSPPLEWTGAPRDTKSFALIVQDPDALGKIWTHWLLFNIPPTVTHLDENQVTSSFTVGINDFGTLSYKGPCPPKGNHRYQFTLYALDIMPNEYPRASPDVIRAGANKQQLLDVMRNHMLASATLTGYYEKKQ